MSPLQPNFTSECCNDSKPYCFLLMPRRSWAAPGYVSKTWKPRRSRHLRSRIPRLVRALIGPRVMGKNLIPICLKATSHALKCCLPRQCSPRQCLPIGRASGASIAMTLDGFVWPRRLSLRRSAVQSSLPSSAHSSHRRPLDGLKTPPSQDLRCSFANPHSEAMI